MPYLVVFQVLAYGVALVLFDALLTDIPLSFAGQWFGADPPKETRELYLDALITVTGIPTLLLLALATVAVPSLSPAISSSLPLLYRRYSPIRLPRRAERVLWAATLAALALWLAMRARDDLRVPSSWTALTLLVAAVAYSVLRMRTNPFHRSLVLAGALTAGIGLLDAAVGLHPKWHVLFFGVNFALELDPTQQKHMLTVFLAAALEILEAAWLLALVIWLLRLRQPTELIQHLRQMAANVIGYVERTSRLTRAQEPALRDDVTCLYEEQEELKQVVQSLEQIGLRFLHDDQPTFSRYAVDALHAIHSEARRLDMRTSDWLVLRSYQGVLMAGKADPWVDLICIRSIAAILYLCAEEHYLSVGNPAASRLEEIAGTGLRDSAKLPLASSDLRARLVLQVLRSYANAYDECVEFHEQLLGDRILSKMSSVMTQIRAVDEQRSGADWAGRLTRTPQEETSLESLFVDCGRLAANTDDVSALRSFLECTRQWRSQDTYRRPLAVAAVDLGAVALAARAYGTASLLIDWVERLDSSGSFFIDAARDYIEREKTERTPERPLEATHTYMRVFVALATTRIMSTSRAWDQTCCEKARALVIEGLPDAGPRCGMVLRRMGTKVPYGEEQMSRWADVTGRWLA